MIKQQIEQKILSKAMSLEKFGLNDIVWDKESAKHLIKSLWNDDIGIWGGSVYKIDSGKLLQTYDNWSYTPNENESAQEFFIKSKVKSFEYIDVYPILSEEKILFSIVFSENILKEDSKFENEIKCTIESYFNEPNINNSLKIFTFLDDEINLNKNLLDAMKKLSPEDLKTINNSIENLDWFSAIETLCIQLYQNKIPISKELFEKISDFGDHVGVDPFICLLLKELSTGSISDLDRRQLNVILSKIDLFNQSKITLSRLIYYIESILNLLDDVSEDWKKGVRGHWWDLEQVYAVALDRGEAVLGYESDLIVAHAIENIKKLIDSKLDDFLKNGKNSIECSADLIDEEWLMCKNCFNAWKSNSLDVLVICPSCDHALRNPRCKELVT